MKIGIIGLGNMGKALLNLFLKNGYDYNVILSDVRKELIDTKSFWSSSTEDNIKTSDIIFLTVKPKDLNFLEQFKNLKYKLVVSCVAGVSIQEIEKETELPIIRMMSNLPIEDRKGSIVYTTNRKVENIDLNKFLKICKGPELIQVDEKKIDISTIMSGSMPAYISYLSEEYINFGIKNGLSREESLKMYISSVEGTMNMMKSYNSEEIISKVSSPGGVTEEGIKYLRENNIKKIINNSLVSSFDKITKLKT